MIQHSAFVMASFLAVILISAPVAASAGTPAGQSPQGLKNSRKVMQTLQERQMKVREKKKQGHAQRKQAQGERQLPPGAETTSSALKSE